MAFLEPQPCHKTYELTVQVVTDEVECLSLIIQVLQKYPEVDRAWIARCLEPQGLPSGPVKTYPLVQGHGTKEFLKG